MTRPGTLLLAAVLATSAGPPATTAHASPTGDPVIGAIWSEEMETSRAGRLAQVLLDSVGPRLTGLPGKEAGAHRAARRYRDYRRTGGPMAWPAFRDGAGSTR